MLTQLQDKQPELLYLPIAAKNVICIVQKLKTMEWAPVLMTSDGLVASVFSQYLEHLKLLEGILVTDFFHYDSKDTAFNESAKKCTKAEKPAMLPWGWKVLRSS